MAFKFKNGETLRKKSTAKYVFISIYALLLLLICASVIPFVTIHSGVPSGDLLLCLVCVLCAYSTLKESVVFALIFGLFADLFLYMPTSFSPVVYVAAAVLSGMCLAKFRNLSSVTVAVCSLPAILIRCSVETVTALTSTDGVSFWSIIGSYTLPMLLVNFACAIVICFIFRRFARILGIMRVQ